MRTGFKESVKLNITCWTEKMRCYKRHRRKDSSGKCPKSFRMKLSTRREIRKRRMNGVHKTHRINDNLWNKNTRTWSVHFTLVWFYLSFVCMRWRFSFFGWPSKKTRISIIKQQKKKHTSSKSKHSLTVFLFSVAHRFFFAFRHLLLNMLITMDLFKVTHNYLSRIITATSNGMI